MNLEFVHYYINYIFIKLLKHNRVSTMQLFSSHLILILNYTNETKSMILIYFLADLDN